MGWSTLAWSTLSSASIISLEKAMSSGTPASAISVVGDARTSRARDAGMITRCLSRGTSFERSAGRVCGGSSASIDGGRLQLFRKLAQLKAFFRAMIVTVCSMKKFSGEPESPDPFLTSCAIGQSKRTQNAAPRRTDSLSPIFYSVVEQTSYDTLVDGSRRPYGYLSRLTPQRAAPASPTSRPARSPTTAAPYRPPPTSRGCSRLSSSPNPRHAPGDAESRRAPPEETPTPPQKSHRP